MYLPILHEGLERAGINTRNTIIDMNMPDVTLKVSKAFFNFLNTNDLVDCDGDEKEMLILAAKFDLIHLGKICLSRLQHKNYKLSTV